MKTIKIEITDPDSQFSKLLEYIKLNSAPGHSFNVIVDPEDSEKKRSFFMDGDGSFNIKSIEEESMGTETLLGPVRTVKGTIIPKGAKVTIASYGKNFKITLRNKKAYVVSETELLNGIVPKRNNTVTAFVNKVTRGKALKRSRVKIAAIVQKSIHSNEVTSKNKNKALKAISNFIEEQNKYCPRCSTQMVVTELSSGVKAWNCPNDRVTLPYN